MTAWELFFQGRYAARKNKKLWFLLWLINALMAMIVALPIFSAFSGAWDHSLMAGRMFDRFNVGLAVELLYKYRDSLPALLVAFVALGIVYLVVTLLTAGGTLAVFAGAEKRFTASMFFRGCGGYFWRFFRLFLVALIFYGIFTAGLNALLSSGINHLTKNWTQERYVLFLTWGRWALVVFVFIVVNMIFDYAKVRLVVDEARSSIAAAFRSIKFVFKNFRKTLALYLLCLLLFVIVVAIYNPLEGVLPQHTRIAVVGVFFLQQIFILARVYVRLTFFASEVSLYESLKPPAEIPAEAFPAPVTPVSPVSGPGQVSVEPGV